MKRYFLLPGSAPAFWHLELAAGRLHQHHGAAGTAGQRQTTAFATAAAAEAAAAKLVREKLAGGYHETDAANAPPVAAGARL